MPRLLQFLVFIAVPIVNYALAFTDGQARFDDDPDILNSPAGYAFSIWGPIFIGMIYYSYQVWRKLDDDPLVRTSCWAGISAGLASIAFVPISVTNLQWLVLLNIIWHLISLIWLYQLNHKMRDQYAAISKWTYLGPQMYLGWIAAATTVSVALFLRDMGVSLPTSTEVFLTCALLLILGFVGAYLATRRGMTIALVVIWALIGIIVKQGELPQIRWVAIVVIAGLLTTILSRLQRGKAFI